MKIKAEYRREMNRNYLILRPDVENKNRYAEKMLSENQIPGLLPFHVKQMDGQSWFYYDITSRQPLERLLEYRNMNGEELCRMMSDILYAIKQMEKFLLDESCLYLTPEFIYAEPDSFRCLLCLVPGSRQDFCGDFRELARYMLDHISHRDTHAVVLAFGIFRESRNENFSMDVIENLVRQAELSREEEWRRTMPEGGGDPGRPDGWSRERPSDSGLPGVSERKKAGPEEGALVEEEPEAEAQKPAAGWKKQENFRKKAGEQNGAEEKKRKKERKKKKEKGEKENHEGPFFSEKSGSLIRTAAVPGVFALVLLAVLTVSGIIQGPVFLLNRLPLAAAALALFGVFARILWEKQREMAEKSGGGTKTGNGAAQEEWEVWFRELDGDDDRGGRPEEGEPRGIPENPSLSAAHGAERRKKALRSAPKMWAETDLDQAGEEDAEFRTVLLYDEADEEEQVRLVPVKGGEEIRIGYFPFIIGKSSSLTDFCLESPGVSRLHLRLDRTENGYTVTDLNSTNGTRIDGKKLEANETCSLSPGAQIEIAGMQYLFL